MLDEEVGQACRQAISGKARPAVVSRGLCLVSASMNMSYEIAISSAG